jgi:hypothetical protein
MKKISQILIIVLCSFGCNQPKTNCFFGQNDTSIGYTEIRVENNQNIKEFVNSIINDLCEDNVTTGDLILKLNTNEKDIYLPIMAIKCPDRIVDLFLRGTIVKVLNDSMFLLEGDTVTIDGVLDDIKYFYNQEDLPNKKSKSLLIFPDNTLMVDVSNTIQNMYIRLFDDLFKGESYDCSYFENLKINKEFLIGIDYQGNIPPPPPPLPVNETEQE